MKKKQNNVIELVKKWVKKADNDIITAENLLKCKTIITDSVCFHCQQAVEKYLKAYLIYNQKYFEKTHDIERILELCSQINPDIYDQLEDSISLTGYSVDLRYPEEFYEPLVSEARDSLKIAKKVKGYILKLISI